MAYNNYFPMGYQPYQAQPQAVQQPQNQILWVQGLEGAKAYPVSAGGSVLLMDSEDSFMFIKTADAAGMPTMRVFKYEEVTQGKPPAVDMSGYVTKEEFEKRLEELTKGAKRAKQTVHDAE